MSKICVIGTTSWGITLGLIACRNKHSVTVWARTEEEAELFNNNGINTKQLPKMPLPHGMTFSSSLEKSLSNAEFIIIAVPSRSMRQNVQAIKYYVNPNQIIISATKGLEHETNLRMSQVISNILPETCHDNICALSGPNLAYEIAKGLPAACVIACNKIENAEKAQLILNCDTFAVYTNNDIIGVELGGSFKNIIAIGAGIIDSMGYGDNTKAAFITRALTEMSAYGMNFGANPLTFAGLAGIGDVMATCSSPLSRNHYVGVELGNGKSIIEVLNNMTATSEGVATIPVVMDEANRLHLEMPITKELYKIICKNKDAREVMPEILGTEPKHEFSGKKWKLLKVYQRFIG